MRHFKHLAISAVIGGFAAIAPVQAETLQSALVAAYNNSNILEQNRALLRATDEDVATALSALRPQISSTSNVTHSDQATNFEGGTLSSSVSLSLQLLVYDAGSTRLGVEAAKELVLATRQGLVLFEQQVLLAAVQAYVGVLRDIRVVELREGNVRLITQELRAARDRFDVGEVTRTDVAQAEARLAQARGDLADAQGNLAISREQYRAAIGRPPGALTGIRSLPALPNTVDIAREQAARQHPSVRRAQHEISANELNVARAQANKNPRITLNADAGHSSRNDNNSSIGLTMTMPIYQGGQLSALHRRAIANLHASRSNLNQEVLTVRQDAATSWATLAVANAQVQASDRQIRAAQVAFNGVREEAKLGARTTLDVLDAEQALSDARTNRVVAETQVYGAAYQLLASTGQLTAQALGLPVETYDPNTYFDIVKTAPVRITPQGKKLDRILKRYENN